MSQPIAADRIARYVALIEAPDTLEIIAQRVADGEGLPEICEAWQVPYGRVLTWLMGDAERYSVYQRALSIDAQRRVSETVDISDNPEGDVARDRLRVDTRFRVAKFHAPEIYGKEDSGNITVNVAAGQVDIALGMAAADLLGKLRVMQPTPKLVIDNDSDTVL